MVDPVEEQVDFLIDEIDAMIAGKYPFKFRDILEHPLDYKDRPTIMMELDKLKGDISDYFERRKENAREAIRLYEGDAAAATKVAKKIADVISEKVKAAKKPFIKPLTYTRKEDEDEIIFVEKYDDSYEGVIDALVKNCLFVVDISMDLEGYTVGRWLFPDQNKNRAIFVSFPVNPAGALDIAKDQMLVAVDAVKSEIQTELALEAPPATPVATR